MPPATEAQVLIDRLGLAPLPGEGGFFRATWRNATASTILFLITREGFSALHRLEQDEVWFFHAGDPVEHIQLDQASGGLNRATLGGNVLAGEEPRTVVPAGIWQGARLRDAANGSGYALFSCVVTPPWREDAFTLGDRETLARAFPAHAGLVRALTR